jgi:hypothetical protein
MLPAASSSSMRRTYVLVLVFEVLVLAALWGVERVYG